MSISSPEQAGSAILILGNGGVEWVNHPGSEHPGHLKGASVSMDVGALGGEAQALLNVNGMKPGACRVLLGADMISQHVVSLGTIPEKEVRSVLHRKAANLLDTELQNTVFTAVQLRDQDGGRWLVSVIHREKLRDLRMGLESADFRVKGFVLARQSLQVRVQERLPSLEEGDAVILVGLEADSVAISLLANGGLVQQTVVPGRFDLQTPVASTVLQELRSFESYWRRQSRGGAITHVVGSGLTKDQADHLVLAMHAALPTAKFQAAEGEMPREEGLARVGYLALCAGSRAQSCDFTLPTPPRRSALIAVTCGVLALGAYLGQEARLQIIDSRASVEVRIMGLESDVSTHSEVEEDLGAVQNAQGELDSHRTRVQKIAGVGVSGREWLDFVQSTFSGRARLDALYIDDTGGQESLSVSGSVPVDPLQSVELLSAIAASWQQNPVLGHYRVQLPNAVSESGNAESELTFKITAAIGGVSQ